jgi:MFS family permease
LRQPRCTHSPGPCCTGGFWSEILNRTQPRIFYGWWIVVVSGFGIFFAPSVTVYSFAVFFPSLVHEFHATRTAISFGFTLHNLVGALWLPLMGNLIDRFGARRVLLSMTLAFALVLLSAPWLVDGVWAFYIFYALLGWTLPGPLGFGVVIAHWFDRRRGLALGLLGLSIGIGAFAVPLLSRWLIARFGWHVAYAIFGGANLFIALPVMLAFLRNDPAELGVLPDGAASAPDPGMAIGLPSELSSSLPSGLSWPEVRREPAFWVMVSAFVMASASLHAGILHLPTLLMDRGFAAQRAALASAFVGVAIIVGRVGCGWLMDRVFAPRVGMLFYALSAAGLVLLWAAPAGSSVFLAAFLVGLGMGAEVDMIAYLASRYFGLRSFATVYGYAFAAFMVAGALGPLMMGAVFDRFHSYSVGVGAAAIASLAAAALLALLGPYRFGPAEGPVEARPALMEA